MGRPLKDIDGEQVFKLARLGRTQEEIGEFFGCDAATISRRFASDFHLGKADCKTSIRRWQMKKGKAGCTTMLIHLGKTYLDQTDKVAIDHTSAGESIQTVLHFEHNGFEGEGSPHQSPGGAAETVRENEG